MKLIGVAGLAGLMTAVIAATGTSPQRSPVPKITAVEAPNAATRTTALDRCRTISAPDADCGAAWDAERRRFFEGAGR